MAFGNCRFTQYYKAFTKEVNISAIFGFSFTNVPYGYPFQLKSNSLSFVTDYSINRYREKFSIVILLILVTIITQSLVFDITNKFYSTIPIDLAIPSFTTTKLASGICQHFKKGCN